MDAQEAAPTNGNGVSSSLHFLISVIGVVSPIGLVLYFLISTQLSSLRTHVDNKASSIDQNVHAKLAALTDRLDYLHTEAEKTHSVIRANIDDLQTKVQALSVYDAAVAKLLVEIETQFDRETRVRFLQINTLRELLDLPMMEWMGSGTRKDDSQ